MRDATAQDRQAWLPSCCLVCPVHGHLEQIDVRLVQRYKTFSAHKEEEAELPSPRTLTLAGT